MKKLLLLSGLILVLSMATFAQTASEWNKQGVEHSKKFEYTQAYEWTLPDSGVNFDEIWKQKPEPVDLGLRKTGEAISYNIDGTILYATSEGKNSPLIEIKRKL